MIVYKRLPGFFRQLAKVKRFSFSASDSAGKAAAPAQTAEEFEEEFRAIVTQTQLDKDESYKEMAARFQREWTKLVEESRVQELRSIDSELTPNEKKKVEYLVEQLSKMNPLEIRYFGFSMREAFKKTSSIDIFSLNMNAPLYKQLSNNPWPFNNPNIATQQNAMASAMPLGAKNFADILVGAMASNPAFMQGVNIVAPGASATAESEQSPKTAEVKKEEPKVQEKLTFDIEVTAIDAAQKIKIIKEVRTITNLGLKEAKDFVEKLPGTIKKEVKKEDAENIKKKLEECGCTVKLV